MTGQVQSSAALECGGVPLSLSSPRVMGILNVTPDSFTDGGILFRDGRLDASALCRAADAMVTAGAAILDIGGESTRPGAVRVSVQEELDRVLGALEVIRSRFDAVISLDTSSPQVMTAGAAAGAGMINDVRALTRDGALQAAAAAGLPVCLMHMQGQPDTMQRAPSYNDVVTEVAGFLQDRGRACEAAGIAPGQIIYDPGFGFGKAPAHNFTLLRQLPDIVALGRPVLAGLSRKSMIASVLPRDTSQRLPASLALAVLALVGGASVLRVHDVAETVDAVAMVAAWADAPL